MMIQDAGCIGHLKPGGGGGVCYPKPYKVRTVAP